MATTSDTQTTPQENEDEDEETYHFTIEVEDNREPQPSVADVFIYNFVKVIHCLKFAGRFG